MSKRVEGLMSKKTHKDMETGRQETVDRRSDHGEWN